MSSSVVSASASGFLGAQVTAPPCRKVSCAAAPVLRIECSSRPQKKATSHHMKTRPKKSQPWDIRRKPTVYPPLPPLPPDWILSEAAAAAAAGASSESPPEVAVVAQPE